MVLLGYASKAGVGSNWKCIVRKTGASMNCITFRNIQLVLISCMMSLYCIYSVINSCTNKSLIKHGNALNKFLLTHQVMQYCGWKYFSLNIEWMLTGTWNTQPKAMKIQKIRIFMKLVKRLFQISIKYADIPCVCVWENLVLFKL